MRKKHPSRFSLIGKARATTYNGIAFKSKLEAQVYRLFSNYNIPLDYEKERFCLLPPTPLSYKVIQSNKGKKTLRAIHYTIDFSNKDLLIEVKGYSNIAWELRFKLLLNHLEKTGNTRAVYVIRSLAEAKKLITDLLSS